MVLGWACVRSLVNTRERISSVFGPEILIIPIAPPGAVASAQIVSVILNAVENFLDEGIDTVLVLGVHLLGIAVGDDHTAGHCAMS